MPKQSNIITKCKRNDALWLLDAFGFRKRKDRYYRKRRIPDVNSEYGFTHDRAVLTEEGIRFEYDYKQS